MFKKNQPDATVSSATSLVQDQGDDAVQSVDGRESYYESETVATAADRLYQDEPIDWTLLFRIGSNLT